MQSSDFDTDAGTLYRFLVVVVLLFAVAALSVAGASAQATAQSDDGPSGARAVVDETEHRVAVPASPTTQDDGHAGSVGDVVDIDLSVEDGASGRLYLGSREKAYLTSVAFSDDGDGEVTLSLDAFRAGGHLGAEHRAWSAESGTVTNVTRHTAPLSDPLEPAIYDLNLTVDGSERAVAPLLLRPASVDGATTAVAPAGAFGDDPADIASTRRNEIASGDTLVANVTTTGVFGMLSAQPGGTTTDRFRSLVTGDNASLEIRPATVDAELALDRSFENDAFDVHADPDAETLSIVMDTAALRYDGESNGIETGERYTVVFWIESESGLTLEDPSIGTEFRARDRTATFETGQNDTVRLAAVPDARLSGTTTLAPGTELEVEARASGTFLRRNETRVGEDGTFTTSLNLSAVDPGTTFTAIVDGLDVAASGIVIDGTDRAAGPDRVPTTERPGDDGTPEATATLGNGRNALPAAEPSPTETEPTPTTRSDTTTDESGAGFGAVAALVAVLSLVGLRLRRRRSA